MAVFMFKKTRFLLWRKSLNWSIYIHEHYLTSRTPGIRRGDALLKSGESCMRSSLLELLHVLRFLLNLLHVAYKNAIKLLW